MRGQSSRYMLNRTKIKACMCNLSVSCSALLLRVLACNQGAGSSWNHSMHKPQDFLKCCRSARQWQEASQTTKSSSSVDSQQSFCTPQGRQVLNREQLPTVVCGQVNINLGAKKPFSTAARKASRSSLECPPRCCRYGEHSDDEQSRASAPESRRHFACVGNGIISTMQLNQSSHQPGAAGNYNVSKRLPSW